MKRSYLTLFFVSLSIVLSACAAQAGRAERTIAAPQAASTEISIPTTERAPTPVLATIPMSLDADGYHVIGDPAAPVVMTDYSDYF